MGLLNFLLRSIRQNMLCELNVDVTCWGLKLSTASQQSNARNTSHVLLNFTSTNPNIYKESWASSGWIIIIVSNLKLEICSVSSTTISKHQYLLEHEDSILSSHNHTHAYSIHNAAAACQVWLHNWYVPPVRRTRQLRHHPEPIHICQFDSWSMSLSLKFGLKTYLWIMVCSRSWRCPSCTLPPAHALELRRLIQLHHTIDLTIWMLVILSRVLDFRIHVDGCDAQEACFLLG